MRRAVSIILLVLGGWMLLGELTVGWLDVGFGMTAQLAACGIMVLFALPLLLLGTWASPGNRSADLGLTLMIAVGIGAATGLMLIVMFKDPTFMQALPPDQKLPDFRFAPLFGAANSLLIAGGGFLLWRRGRGSRSKIEELETVFGD